MQQVPTTLEILPGHGIGPFRLGMTRGQVREIAQRELGIEVDAAAAIGRDHDPIGDTGLVIHYDGNGRCKCVEALLDPFLPSAHSRDAFTLFGERIRGKGDAYIIQLCKDHWSDVSSVYGGITVPSAGISALYWDSSLDGDFYAMEVEPPQPGISTAIPTSKSPHGR